MPNNQDVATKLKELAAKLRPMFEEKKLWIGQIKARLDEAKVAYPEDQAIRQVSALMDTMYEKNKFKLLTASELQSCFNSFDTVQSQSHWPKVMADLLPEQKKEASSGLTPAYQRHAYDGGYRGDLKEAKDNAEKLQESKPHVEVREPLDGEYRKADKDLKEFTEQGLTEKLLSTSTPFKKRTVEGAKSVVETEFSSMGFENPEIFLDQYKENKLIYSAVIDTNRGKFSVKVPVEI